ncbi:MAG: hypothetical protein F6K47_14185 [Symploca sp. SIO2E6]|nr:hypothetical protein [Symploca sp. SIO2E6]
MSENQQKPKQPLLKAQTIKLLLGTIKLLEGIVKKLEAAPVTQSAPVVDSSTTTVEADIDDTGEPVLVTSISDIPTVTPETTEEAVDDSMPQPQKTKLTARLLPSFASLQSFWAGLLAKIRSLFPPSWNDKLSDWGLTGAIATIIIVILLTTVTLLPQTPAPEEKAPRATIETPPELKAPKQPQAVAVEPPPLPVLTPEQSLISTIQHQVAQITEEYGKGLIKAIQANFLESRLIVKVGNGWYELETEQQDKLAAQMFAQAVELDFSKLEINDLEGTLVARNPVVGPRMVIFRR